MHDGLSYEFFPNKVQSPRVPARIPTTMLAYSLIGQMSNIALAISVKEVQYFINKVRCDFIIC